MSTSTNMCVQWNATTLQAIRTAHPAPTVAARALAIVHTCIYDAWANYDAVSISTRLGAALRRPTTEHTPENKQQAMSYAAYRALLNLFPTQASYFASIMAGMGYDPNNASTDTTTPIGIGNLSAQYVLAWRQYDGANQLGDLHPGAYSDYTGYIPLNTPDMINDPNHWQPLRVSNGQGGFVVQTYATPHWGQVAPFALTSGSQLRPAEGPAKYHSNLYRTQAEELLHISATLSDKQKVIAEYWKDGPSSELPPGHWCLFAQYVSQRDTHSLDSDVKLFFTLTNALLDSSIACWDTKRVYNSVRPITAIHYLYQGKKVLAWAGPNKGAQLIDGTSWLPYQPLTVVTPPFPEYCSGHSTFSAASAEILRRWTHSDSFGASYTQAAGTSAVEPGTTPATDITLSWHTFSDAADEAGISRRYGGIHFEQGDLVGRTLGRSIAALVWQKAHGYIQGHI